MPSAFPATVAEREAELIALQSAFDEYIASSRELEEELDAELAKMQEKLAESTAANAALSAQLENISPQLASLENALTESRNKLREEQKLRRAAENAQDEADQRVRELEQSLQQVREECDDIHEELAFRENELEEMKLELEVEKQQLINELAAAREQAATAPSTTTTSVEGSSEMEDSYVKKLEEELELVTEQLIDMEKRLSEAEADLVDKNTLIQRMQAEGRREEDEEIIRTLQTENADRLETEERLRNEISVLKEELALSKEEVALQQEELHAAEEDYKATTMALEEERIKHKEEVTQLNMRIKEAEMATTSTLGEAAMVATTVQSANEENAQLKDELISLEAALANAKKDYETVMEELEAVNARFDEAREEARREGEELARENLRNEKKSDSSHELNEARAQLEKLIQENRLLQEKVDATEVALAAASDRESGDAAGGGSEVVKQLQAQLARSKEELVRKNKEISELSEITEQRLSKAEENVVHLESQLRATKASLAEAEARIIVLKREKERAENVIPPSPRRAKGSVEIPDGSPSPLSLSAHRGGRGRSTSPSALDREELGEMEDTPTPSKGRHRARSSSPSSVMRLEFQLAEQKTKYAELEKAHNELLDQKRMGEVRMKRMEEDLRFLRKQVFEKDGATVTQMTRLSSLASSQKGTGLEEDDEMGRVDKIIDSRDLKAMASELKSLEKKCNSQRIYNAELLSKMLHLQGNIQVYCRVRPMSLSEIEKGYKSAVEALSENEVGCFDSRTNKWKSFAFDRVWGPDQSQQSVFQDVEPLALSVVDGFNACIFAYGQTGSGKTFTMEGVRDNGQFGISYRTIQKIFHLLNLRAQQQRAAEMFVGQDQEEDPAKEVSFQFSIEVGMLEIYNDEIYDLLGTAGSSMAEKKEGAMKAGGKSSLDIRRTPEGRVEVPNLTKEKVNSIEEVMELLKRGNSNRATASTDMNTHSSRSHMVLMVDVKSGLDESQSNKGTLYLVDLAGSERVRKSNVEGDQLKEAGFINKSLSALGNVMEALDRKASHVPYRDSKLTYMLQDSLGGNSRTMMVVAINPVDNSFDESIHALQFATRVRRIQIGSAQRNVTSKNLEETVKSLTEEMRALTRAKERTESQLLSLKRDNSRVQEKLQNLNKSKQQSRSDSKTLEVLRKNNDDMAQRWQKEKTAREEMAEELENARKELRTLKQKLSKAEMKVDNYEKSLEVKEHELEVASKQLREQRNNNSAASARARRDMVLRNPASTVSKSVASSFSSRPSTPSQASTTGSKADVRSKVLTLLQKHDPVKADRIDIIMEKFAGKEDLLLEKMTQRYEGNAPSSVSDRNKLSVQRHQERMKRIREKQNASNSGS